MSWCWTWSTIIDRGTCTHCFGNNGTVHDQPEDFGGLPPVHTRCRCILLLTWRWLGAYTSSETIAPEALLASEQETRVLVHDGLEHLAVKPSVTHTDIASAVALAILAGKTRARAAGRMALAHEAQHLRPGSNVAGLMGKPRRSRHDEAEAKRRGKKHARWWLVAVAAIVAKHEIDRHEAQRRATLALRKKLEAAVITDTAEAFNDEREKAAKELP